MEGGLVSGVPNSPATIYHPDSAFSSQTSPNEVPADFGPARSQDVSTSQHDHDDFSASYGVGKARPGRKSRACTECKRLKMKCEVPAGNRKCKYCLRRGIDCSLLFAKPHAPSRYDDAGSERRAVKTERYEQKIDLVRNELHQVRSALDALVQRGASIKVDSNTAPLISVQGADALTSPQSNAAITTVSDASAREENMQMAMTRENSIEPEQGVSRDPLNGGDVTVEEPMSSLYEVTRLRNIRSNQAKTARPLPEGTTEVNDFISRGVISEREAQDLYITFHTSLNHYLWVGLEQLHTSLLSVRRSSELLTATILAVTALHIPTSAETFDKCYKEFLSLISSSMFSRYHNVDDVRGLCIGAFWLSDVSWKLSGHAIRIATELGIHQSFSRALEGDREHFLRARLWYMLFVCDGHFSHAYGRPPMISESLQIRESELFLQVSLADALDQRILSQVTLIQILHRIHDRFAGQRLPQQGQSEATLHESDFIDMRNFNSEIDQWRIKWNARQEPNHFIGTFPPKGIIMYSYFAKLQLNSLAMRGVSISHGRLSTERKEFANTAISAAASILTFVLEEEDMRRALVGMPLYFHTMIAFASVFLMKVTTKWNRIVGLNVEPTYVLELLERIITLMKNSMTSARHLLPHIAAGLEKMLAKSKACTPNPTHFDSTAPAQRLFQPQGGQFNAQSDTTMLQPPSSLSNDPALGLSSPIDGTWNQFGDDFGGQNDMSDMTILNDNWIHEAFGSDSANDVYNLLTSQFSY